MTVDVTHDPLAVLMVHSTPCIRLLKEARALSRRGVVVDVLCESLDDSPLLESSVRAIHVCEMPAMHDFLLEKHTQWDVIHCHNEPNTVTVIALGACARRPVIYDCHDMSSARSQLADDDATLEKLCFTRSHGVVHVSDGLKKLAFKRYGPSLSIVLPSLPQADSSRIGAMPKLPGNHVVYQGGITDDPLSSSFSYRFYLPMFRALLEAGVHVHIFPSKVVAPERLEGYAALAARGLPLHCHDYLPYDELIATMSQYQWGFSGFNMDGIDNPTTREFLNSALPNKFFDYLLAGVCPVVINNTTTAEFALRYGVGYAARDMADFVDICRNRTPLPPMNDLSAIDMDAQIERLLGLYRAVMANRA